MENEPKKNPKKSAKKKPQPHADFIDISQKLRKIRELKRLTLVEASEKIGIGFVFLSEIERALKAPSAEAIKGIASVYEISECDLAISYRKIPVSVLDALTKRKDVLRMVYDVANSDVLSQEEKETFYNDVVSKYVELISSKSRK
ncbi:helix-turn-helix transcriptional regulator [Bacillus cereus]|uniref:helix-turn-helix domain-containing protein n=1 Tax=Bacillus cereus TaxID=1396 RepID=UPI001F0F6DF7|nr:helix-turn-helix transcriptional regulator [Bacillus cereus]MCH5476723.1 helix-turn-helix transcriptional regulator [Bacillus cereus]